MAVTDAYTTPEPIAKALPKGAEGEKAGLRRLTRAASGRWAARLLPVVLLLLAGVVLWTEFGRLDPGRVARGGRRLGTATAGRRRRADRLELRAAGPPGMARPALGGRQGSAGREPAGLVLRQRLRPHPRLRAVERQRRAGAALCLP